DKPYIRWIEYCRVGFNPPIKSICYGYMVGQDPPYKLLPPQVGESQKYLPPLHCKKKKKKKTMGHTKLKIK
ncbi:hypothetical protein ACOARR_06765, partial [Glaesserella parasuis]|uniref:hypothetical protein n=1 Tax=Glaesserella parasuis TaxID=738 RepID=UPI003B815026